jgi:hypothetical protein
MFPLLDDEYSARAHLAHKPRGGIEDKKKLSTSRDDLRAEIRNLRVQPSFLAAPSLNNV